MPAWLRILGLVTLAYGLLLLPLITSIAFQLEMLWEPERVGPDDFPLPADTPLTPARTDPDLGVVSTLVFVALGTAFGLGSLGVARRRRRSARAPRPFG